MTDKTEDIISDLMKLLKTQRHGVVSDEWRKDIIKIIRKHSMKPTPSCARE